MRKVKKLKYDLAFGFPEEKKFTLKWFFGSSHLLMGIFSALGVFMFALYLSNFFYPHILAFLFIYLIIHLILAFDYLYDRNIEEKLLFFFYLFSILILVLKFLSLFINF